MRAVLSGARCNSPHALREELRVRRPFGEAVERGIMRIRSVRVRNFRRLKDVSVDLEGKTTVFVGANNSGKTSATQVFRCFFDGTGRLFTVHDFSADCWTEIDKIGSEAGGAEGETSPLP